MPFTTSVRHIMEAGLVAILQAEPTLAGVNIYTGDSTATAVHPKVVVICESAECPTNFPDGLGNYDCNIRVIISDNANDTNLATHRQREASVLATLSDEQAIKDYYAAQDPIEAYIYTLQRIPGAGQGIDPEGNYWNSVVRLQIRCVINPA